jgi:serine/threonine protein kinase
MNLFEPLQPIGPLRASVGQTLQPGDMLEAFEVLQVLGLTNFGVLYLARHRADGSTVALKEYMPSALARRAGSGDVELLDPSHAQAYERGLQAFVTQALSLSAFDHPHLLRVQSIWEAHNTAYRTMPYLSGATLMAERSRAGAGPMSQARLRKLFDGLLDGLGMLYQNGLAHGRIEPQNIFLLDDGHPVLLDFDAVHLAVLSDPREAHVDAYADPARMPGLVIDDLHALAAVLHFAVSGDWVPEGPHEELADVLLRYKDSASALDYQPEFLLAIDTALTLTPGDLPGTITEFRALFEPRPERAVRTPPPVTDAAPPRTPPPKWTAPSSIPPAYPLGSSESVLALLANFDRGAHAAEDVEPFQSPEVPTLTEEAEPALPPLRESLFDAMDAGEVAPESRVGYTPVGYTPMPRIPRNRWHHRGRVIGFVGFIVVCLGALGWLLTA